MLRPRALALACAVVVALPSCGGTAGTHVRANRSSATSWSVETAGVAPTPVPHLPSSAPLPPGEDTTVERVVDGDTIKVASVGKVRLIGIDTPETKDPRKPVECFGREAARRAEELMGAGTAVRLVYDAEREDRYGRTLAYVYRIDDGLFVNAALVVEGFAQAYTVPPNVAHADEFVALTSEAREARRGLWSACPPAPG